MNKTEYMLMSQTNGLPVMHTDGLAKLLNVTRRSLQNQIYSKRLPFPVFRIGTEWVAHVSDVATWLDGKPLRQELPK